MTYTIEATLAPDPEDATSDFKADIVFSHLPGAGPTINDIDGGDPGWPAEVEILHIAPFGVVPPINADTLSRLADEWLDKHGGYDACCRLAEAKNGGWE